MTDQTVTDDQGNVYGEGGMAFNYYASTLDDSAIGVIGSIGPDGWFTMYTGQGEMTLNGERICSLATALKRGWLRQVTP
jgi:hypothetical protein